MKFAVPARVKHKAITAGVVGGILFFIVAIILSICAVKICNKRKRRKQEKGTPRGDFKLNHLIASAWILAYGHSLTSRKTGTQKSKRWNHIIFISALHRSVNFDEDALWESGDPSSARLYT